MRFNELCEQFGDPIPFRIPTKIASIKPRPDYRQKSRPSAYKVAAIPQHVPVVDPVDTGAPKSKTTSDKPLPLRVGKEVIKPTDPRYAAIMSLLKKQQTQP